MIRSAVSERSMSIHNATLVVIINHVERAQRSTVTEAITHEVDRPGLIGPDRLDQRFGYFGAIALLEPATHIEFHVAIHAPNAFMIPLLACPARQRKQLWKAVSGMSLRQRTERVDNGCIVDTLGRVAMRRATDIDDPTGATLAQFMSAHGVGDQCPFYIRC